MRDDFPMSVKEALAKRVAMRCSNPKCGKVTTGPHEDSAKAVNIGVAAHITAASPGGPRYDCSLLTTDRNAAQNGIWLCQNCAKMVDNDPQLYSVDLLKAWKTVAEHATRSAVEHSGINGQATLSQEARLRDLHHQESHMPLVTFDGNVDYYGSAGVSNYGSIVAKGYLRNRGAGPAFEVSFNLGVGESIRAGVLGAGEVRHVEYHVPCGAPNVDHAPIKLVLEYESQWGGKGRTEHHGRLGLPTSFNTVVEKPQPIGRL